MKPVLGLNMVTIVTIAVQATTSDKSSAGLILKTTPDVFPS